MPIIDIQRRLAETGRIRIGQQVATGNGSKKRPAKLEKFRLTTANRTALEAVATKYGGTVKKWADSPVGNQWELFTDSEVLDVVVPPEAMAFSQFYELWSAGGCKRRCDGNWMIGDEKECLCDPENRECKPHTRLSIMLEGVEGSGLWRLDTQGWNAANELGGAFELANLIAQATGRSIVPGHLRLNQREVKRPDPENPEGVITRRFAVPVLDFDVDLSAIARGSQAALSQGQSSLSPASRLTPIPPSNEPSPSLADQLAQVNHPEARKPRSNAAEPVRSTGIGVRPRGAMRGDEDVDGPTGPSGATGDSQDRTGAKADGESMDRLQARIDLLREAGDGQTFAEAWKAIQLPPLSHGLTQGQCLQAISVADEILNAQVEVYGTDENGEYAPDDVPIVKADAIIAPSITNPQIGKIRVMVANLGVDKADVHTYVSDILRRQIGSLRDLTKAEAHRVIDQLTENEKAGRSGGFNPQYSPEDERFE